MYREHYIIALPYPDCRPAHPDRRLARLLFPRYAGRSGALDTMTHYLYAALCTADCRPELSAIFSDIAEVELTHFRLLGGLIRDLGGAPVIRLCHDGSRLPGDPCTAQGARALLAQAARAEQASADTYRYLARQTDDCTVCELLERLAMDEEAHAQAFCTMLK